jgi:hypothetical protein
MAKKAKARTSELRYAKRARELAGKRKKRTHGDTPWKTFFTSGVGATLETELKKSSIRAIVNTYGTRLGKRFTCSYQDQVGSTLVTIDAVRSRE